MEEELENGIALMEGILQNWENGNKGKYHIFFPRCAKENDKDVILFPIFEETKNKTLNLKIWAKYNLENYSLEEYLDVKNKVILFDKKLINYKKKKFAKNVIALIEIFYTAQEFIDLSEDSIEYIANQELLEEKIYEYKQNFKTILQEEELAIAYGVKKNEPVKTEKAKLPVTNNVVDIQNIESNAAKIQKVEPILADIQNPEASVEKIQNKKPSVENIKKAESNITNIQKSEQKEEKKKVDLTIKRLQESILKIDNKNSSKERYMLKLIEEVGELAKVINEDARMKDKEIKGTIEEELQDVLYYVTCLANLYEIDLEECIYLKEELNCKKYDRENIFKGK
ncbi:MAG TPA: hypothetical protein OIM48_05375 [Clostridiaceae bacterium]|nr:hypothetical protein [Clostridiaceae bacterium]